MLRLSYIRLIALLKTNKIGFFMVNKKITLWTRFSVLSTLKKLCLFSYLCAIHKSL